MPKILKYSVSLLPGTVCGALAVLLSRLLIRSLDTVLRCAGAAVGLDQQMLTQIAQVLIQLHQATVVSAWLPILALGAAAGVCLLRLHRKSIVICLWFLLLLALTAAALWFTEVNDVRAGALVSCLLPMLPHL